MREVFQPEARRNLLGLGIAIEGSYKNSLYRGAHDGECEPVKDRQSYPAIIPVGPRFLPRNGNATVGNANNVKINPKLKPPATSSPQV
jgi:hypothetical protein